MQNICIHDPSLRDGSHAINHQLSLPQIECYIKAIDKTGINVIEVGHGLGLGASSCQLGFSKHSDHELIHCARQHVQNAKLGVHITPGYGSIYDLQPALEAKVDVIRVATHCSEADLSAAFIQFAQKYDVEIYVALTMSHMLDANGLLAQAKLIESYGADGVILMDSAGAYFPMDVRAKISTLVSALKIKIGFHAHNNLGLAVANSLEAVLAGATIIDGTTKGFGAGSGNTPLELIVAVLKKLNYCQHIDLCKLLQVTAESADYLVQPIPTITNTNIMSGLHGVFCGFDHKVRKIADELNIEPLKIYERLGQQKIIAGQEDKIIEIAYQLQQEFSV